MLRRTLAAFAAGVMVSGVLFVLSPVGAQEGEKVCVAVPIFAVEVCGVPTTTQPPTTAPTQPPTQPPTTAPPTTQPPSGGLIPSGPITITGDNVVIENRHFTGSAGNCITINGASNVVIRNSLFTNCHKAVYALNSSNVVVDNIDCVADQSNRGRNCVQFDKVQGGAVRNITSHNTGLTAAEDHISIYQSHGTQANPILVENNVISGGGPSGSGSCIMLGDGSSNPGSWQVARGNHCTNTANVGIAIAGGTNNKILDNTIISEAGENPEANVGIYVWRWAGTQPCSGHEVSNNRVRWIKSNGSSNPFWNGGNCGTVVMVGNDFSYDGD
jgi:hypothetical protein